MRVGLPQALLFWSYAPLWIAFLEGLGVEVLVSGETTRATLDAGVKLSVDEACLPVKVYYGHCAALADRVDALFVPRLVSVEPRAYICPKFMGLPDMLRPALGPGVQVIAPTVDLRTAGSGLARSAAETGRLLGKSRRSAAQALSQGLAALREARREIERGALPPAVLAAHGYTGPYAKAQRERGRRRRMGILGHPYNVYDRQVSMDLLARLEALDWEVVTPEMVPAEVCLARAGELPKDLFWTLGSRVYGAAVRLTEEGVFGLIHLVSFGCGPDSLVGELVHGLAERRGLPFLMLTLDEHTGEAGLWTRVEAFLDMIERREVRAVRPS